MQQNASDLTKAGANDKAPSEEQVVSLLQRRFRRREPFTSLGPRSIVAINPFEVHESLSEASASAYANQTLDPQLRPAPSSEQHGHDEPHLYAFAGKVYSTMALTKRTQALVYTGCTGSGKSYSSNLVTQQLLRLGSLNDPSTPEFRLADKVRALNVVLDSFGNCKTTHSTTASQYGRYLELHFRPTAAAGAPALAAAQFLTFGLNKSRVTKPSRDERTFDVFYQMIAGVSSTQRQQLALKPLPSDYSLMAGSATASGLTRSGGEPSEGHTADRTAYDELMSAFTALNFKGKHMNAIFRVLSAILLLGNVTFTSSSERHAAQIEPDTLPDLEVAAALLGLPSDDLSRVLTNRSRFVRNDYVSYILTPKECEVQRDSISASLYTIVFAFIVETANARLFPGQKQIETWQAQGGSSIVQLDLPGFQSRSQNTNSSGRGWGLVQSLGEDRLPEFCANAICQEVLQHWLHKQTFEDDVGENSRMLQDGIQLPSLELVDRSVNRLELIRGGTLGGRADSHPGGILGGLAKTCSNVRKGKVADKSASRAFVEQMRESCKTYPSFVALGGSNAESNMFGIQHFAAPVTYEASDFVERALDLVDADFVTLLRSSDDSFISKLLSGPGLSVEMHPKDPEITIAAQVSAQPLRQPTTPQTAHDVSARTAAASLEGIHPLTTQVNASMARLLKVIEQCQLWNVACIRPNASFSASLFDAKGAKSQITALQLVEASSRRSIDFVADFAPELVLSYLGITEGGPERLRVAFEEKELVESQDYVIGNARIWLGPKAFKVILQSQVDQYSPPQLRQAPTQDYPETVHSPTSEQQDKLDEARSTAARIRTATRLESGGEKRNDDLEANAGTYDAVSGGDPFNQHSPDPMHSPVSALGELADDAPLSPLRGSRTFSSNPFNTPHSSLHHLSSAQSLPDKEGQDDWGSYHNKSQSRAVFNEDGQVQGDTELELVETSKKRRIWLALVWGLTWWIPNFALKHVGRMKRPDVRLAWREKVTICFVIFMMCAMVVFYIIGFGLVLCPEFNKVWTDKELGYHQAGNDFYVAIRGEVYDITNFWKSQHSDIDGSPVYQDNMLELAGKDLSNYFPPPLSQACPDLVDDDTMELMRQGWAPEVPSALHTSGNLQADSDTNLKHSNWLWDDFYPFMKKYHKGPLVYHRHNISKSADVGDADDSTTLTYIIYDNGVYDLTDYFYTLNYNYDDKWEFLDPAIGDLIQSRPGQDLTSVINDLNDDQISSDDKQKTLNCMKELFYKGKADPRDTARCQAQPYMLLAFSIIIITVLAAKFLASLQFATKRVPEPRDKFAILQVPCYTEGEESLRKTIESLAKLKYDDKRKLLFLICDGMIVGSGNDKPTPRIVLDILGATAAGVPDPDPMMFKSIGEGSKQINYGKVYSGLYEHEGHVVPYLVVVKVGKPSERSRPGNRGKRDSQILLMRFLNRVHEDTEMAPLELEMYHQIKNIIGVDPSFYEYLLCVDADTEVHHDSLNRLIAVAHDDQRILGLCGETKISNERTSLTTMVQVYEYFISHHMAKAFESLFGTVTCLPGCFTLYRIRNHEGKPLLVSNNIIQDYAENHIDTLHKKNLLSLGEDRYLTTLILKYFPKYKTKFTQDALAFTSAPDEWKVLISQRRRWINSTVHNLIELLYLNDMCGTCCFSMRFVVMLDLVSTLILPATTVYLVYLIVAVSTGSGTIPLYSIIMLGAVYGLQIIVFLLKREWAFIGWLVIYLCVPLLVASVIILLILDVSLAYPLYSFFLPCYSFWKQDDFSWGNTRVVVGEGKNKKVLAGAEDEPFDDSMIPMRRFADYQAQAYSGVQQPGVAANKAASVSGFSMMNPQGSPSAYAGSVSGMPLARGSSASFAQLPSAMHLGELPRPMSYMSPYGTPTAFPSPSVMGMPAYTGSMMGMQPPTAPWATGMPRHSSSGSLGGGSAHGSDTAPLRESRSYSPLNVVSNRPLSTFSSSPGGLGGSPPGLGSAQNRQSNFSLFSNFNMPSVSESTNPSDEELRNATRNYLATQDLMTVTKRTTREAVAQLFPRANLSSRKEFLNSEIDAFCSGT